MEIKEAEEIQLENPEMAKKEDLCFLQRSDTEDVCTFLWLIENFSCWWCQTGERLLSPNFTLQELEGISWWMSVYPRGEFDEDRGYISLYIGLNTVDDLPHEIDLNYELSVLSADGSIFCSKVDANRFFTSTRYGWPKFVEIEKITQDTVIVRCRIWKSGVKAFKSPPILARTRIGVEEVSFLLEVENFSTFEPNQQKTVEMHSQSESGFVVSSSLYFNDEDEVIIEIRPSDTNHYICKRKISLLGAFGNKVLCEETDNRLDLERKDIEKLPFPHTKQFLLNKKSQYLPDDKLTLLCECSFTTGMEMELTAVAERGAGAEKVSIEIPDNRNHALSIEEPLESFTFDFTLKYRIEDFSTANEEVYKRIGEESDLFAILINVSVFPNGADTSEKGWLVVRPVVTVRNQLKLLMACSSLFTVSIIDVEGNPKFFRYFEICLQNVRGVKYLERSFILERAGELISDGVLFLRCYIRVDLRVEKGFIIGSSSGLVRSSVQSCDFSVKGTEINDRHDTVIHDFTSQILALPQFHESRRRFGVYGIPPLKWNERDRQQWQSGKCLDTRY